MKVPQVYYKSLSNQTDTDQLPLVQERLPQSKRDAILKKRDEADRQRSLTAYWLLEQAARELGVEGFQLGALTFTEEGKPCLPESGLEFSLSHSGDHVICAVSLSGPVGADVECYRDTQASKFKRHFNPDERDYANQGPHEFCQIWTAKEALAKALGKGVKLVSEVSVEPLGGRAEFHEEHWSVQYAELPNACVALVTPGRKRAGKKLMLKEIQ